MHVESGRVRPRYDGPCISNLVGALQGGADWIPEAARGASAVVMVVLDGFGHNELKRRKAVLPALSSMEGIEGGAITSVVPSTTPTALTSISTGVAPSEHGILGYRMWLGGGTLNVIRWAMQGMQPPDPSDLQPRDAFRGQALPVVTRAQFRATKFTNLLYRGADFHGYMTTTGLIETCRLLVEAGERFVYAYYDGPDLVAHVHGLRDGFFEREAAYCDQMVAQLLDALPSTAAVVVTADHGHMHFDERIELGPLNDLCVAQSGESRFRYLHARAGAEGELLAETNRLYGDRAWCMTRDQVIEEAWLGPRPPSSEVRRRIGDVVLAARDAVGFVDPDNPGESRLVSGHGSLTPDEMLVPLLAARGRR